MQGNTTFYSGFADRPLPVINYGGVLFDPFLFSQKEEGRTFSNLFPRDRLRVLDNPILFSHQTKRRRFLSFFLLPFSVFVSIDGDFFAGPPSPWTRPIPFLGKKTPSPLPPFLGLRE